MQKRILERRIPFPFKAVFHGLLKTLDHYGMKTSACDMSQGRIQLDGERLPRTVPTFQLINSDETSTLVRLEMGDNVKFDELMNDLIIRLAATPEVQQID